MKGRSLRRTLLGIFVSLITNGSGSIVGGQANTQGITFQGVSAGSINQNNRTFSGSATGIAR